jgi:hypothetical protein
MFDLTSDELESFEGRFWRPTFVAGPIMLARFSDSARGEQGRFGRFWLYGDYLLDLMRTAPHAMGLVKQISQSWAICDDWGDKGLLSLMEVPPGRHIPAVWGRAKFQPKVFNPEARATDRSYTGGALQLVIPVVGTDPDRRVDPALAALVTRRLMTADILANPAKVLENVWVTSQRRAGRNL